MAWCKLTVLSTILRTGDFLQTRLSWVSKAVLQHNGNTPPSIPVGHSVHNKELYENRNILLEAINYDKFK